MNSFTGFVRILAAEFWMSCSLSIVFLANQCIVRCNNLTVRVQRQFYCILQGELGSDSCNVSQVIKGCFSNIADMIVKIEVRIKNDTQVFHY